MYEIILATRLVGAETLINCIEHRCVGDFVELEIQDACYTSTLRIRRRQHFTD